ncbi:hypothetical protein CIL05_12170 [Virgibacillus profundi]|uniref:Uncharacterized protein n=1 Tax=Virgibacillus profundi TaxID=2024555 RepID=A0A2A2IAX9_9BACI|nr:hypothetical protein [Virgibacillus profundi]PAV29151.1 hypothetical protein CIL05_12170 [Virgibacillus profundi]PXY53320.1 hypothetical protein CIT14_12295 [Virgibacillus profundi]
MKKHWKLGLLCIVIFLTGALYMNIGFPWDYLKMKDDFNKHLTQYETEMTLKDIRYDFLHDEYHGKAHPKNNPDLQFHIGQNQRTGEIEDDYKFERIRLKANQEVSAILERYLPQRIKPASEIEVVAFDTKALEINVLTKKVVDAQTKEKIKQSIIEIGYLPEQLFFETKSRE